MPEPAKPTVTELGIDLDAQTWRRSGVGPADLEVAFAGDWVLMRVSGAADGQVLVFDHAEWDAFVRGVKDREFDDAAGRNGR